MRSLSSLLSCASLVLVMCCAIGALFGAATLGDMKALLGLSAALGIVAVAIDPK